MTSLLRTLMALIGITLVICIYVYTHMIKARSGYSTVNTLVSVLRVSNAELKNSYYQMMDNQHLVNVSDQLGYVKDANPNYLRLSAAPTVTKEISLSQ